MVGSGDHPAAPLEIVAEHIARSFGERRVLRDVGLSIRAGEIVAIVGASGSGKTVLLDHLVGLLRPDSGRILVADHDAPPRTVSGVSQPPMVDLAEIDDERLDAIRLHWAVVFQRNALFTGSVRDNIALWLREHTSLPEERVEERVKRSLEAAALNAEDVLEKDRDALSGGMAKRVAIARAIAVDPIVIFYDEPTTGLDPIYAGQIHELIWKTHQSLAGELFDDSAAAGGGGGGGVQRTSIFVTHDKELLRRIAPRVVMLHEGKVCFDGPYREFGKGDCGPAREYLEQMPVLHARQRRAS